MQAAEARTRQESVARCTTQRALHSCTTRPPRSRCAGTGRDGLHASACITPLCSIVHAHATSSASQLCCLVSRAEASEGAAAASCASQSWPTTTFAFRSFFLDLCDHDLGDHGVCTGDQ
jgi:hypothetical protein